MPKVPPYRVQNGDIIRAAREFLGLTQTQVAEMIGISQRFYAKIEAGKTPGLEYQQKIREMLNIQGEQKAAETGRQFDEVADLHARKEAGEPMAALLWEMKKITGKLDELTRAVETLKDGKLPSVATPTVHDRLDRVRHPDEHQRPQAPTYPPPNPIPGGSRNDR